MKGGSSYEKVNRNSEGVNGLFKVFSPHCFKKIIAKANRFESFRSNYDFTIKWRKKDHGSLYRVFDNLDDLINYIKDAKKPLHK